jgi:hypothetical protein
MWPAMSVTACAVGAGMRSTVSDRARLLHSSIRLPASIMGMKWPTPQTGSSTTVGFAIDNLFAGYSFFADCFKKNGK